MKRKAKSPIDRINDAMAVARIRTPSELARRMGLPRQTIHRWLSDGVANINYRNLLKLSDVLNVNARWIMFGEVGRIKVPYSNPHESEAAGLARELPKDLRDQWLAFGRGLLEVQRVRNSAPARSRARG